MSIWDSYFAKLESMSLSGTMHQLCLVRHERNSPPLWCHLASAVGREKHLPTRQVSDVLIQKRHWHSPNIFLPWCLGPLSRPKLLRCARIIFAEFLYYIKEGGNFHEVSSINWNFLSADPRSSSICYKIPINLCKMQILFNWKKLCEVLIVGLHLCPPTTKLGSV